MHENKNAYSEKTIIGMVKSSQFGKIAKQAGRNKIKQAWRKYFSDLLNEQAENLRAEWQKNLKKSKHALLLGTSE